MSNADDLDQRLRAVERTLTDTDDGDLTDLRDAAELTNDVETLGERLDDAEARLDELDAATQALRGYVGNVRAVNESVERRADAALAKAETLEAEALETDTLETDGASPEPVATDGRATESDAAAPCSCQSRRPETANVADDASHSSGNDRGLLARIAEGLARIAGRLARIAGRLARVAGGL